MTSLSKQVSDLEDRLLEMQKALEASRAAHEKTRANESHANRKAWEAFHLVHPNVKGTSKPIAEHVVEIVREQKVRLSEQDAQIAKLSRELDEARDCRGIVNESLRQQVLKIQNDLRLEKGIAASHLGLVGVKDAKVRELEGQVISLEGELRSKREIAERRERTIGELTRKVKDLQSADTLNANTVRDLHAKVCEQTKRADEATADRDHWLRMASNSDAAALKKSNERLAEDKAFFEMRSAKLDKELSNLKDQNRRDIITWAARVREAENRDAAKSKRIEEQVVRILELEGKFHELVGKNSDLRRKLREKDNLIAGIEKPVSLGTLEYGDYFRRFKGDRVYKVVNTNKGGLIVYCIDKSDDSIRQFGKSLVVEKA